MPGYRNKRTSAKGRSATKYSRRPRKQSVPRGLRPAGSMHTLVRSYRIFSAPDGTLSEIFVANPMVLGCISANGSSTDRALQAVGGSGTDYSTAGTTSMVGAGQPYPLLNRLAQIYTTGKTISYELMLSPICTATDHASVPLLVTMTRATSSSTLANDNIANVLTSYASSNPSQAMLTPTDNRMAVYKKVITPSKSNPYENETYPLSQTVGKVHKTEGVAGNVGKTLGYIKIHAEGFAKYGNSQSIPHNAGSFGDDPSAATDANGASLSAAVPLYQVIERVQIWCQDIRTGA